MKKKIKEIMEILNNDDEEKVIIQLNKKNIHDKDIITEAYIQKSEAENGKRKFVRGGNIEAPRGETKAETTTDNTTTTTGNNDLNREDAKQRSISGESTETARIKSRYFN